MKSVPEVPREMLQALSPTVPVPTAAAALSPAPAATMVDAGIPSSAAMSALTVPMDS